MDTFEFIAELVGHLAWPTVTIALVLLLRKPVSELIPLLRKLKYRELELDFSKEIAAIEAEASASDRETLPQQTGNVSIVDSTRIWQEIESKRENMLRMVSYSPRVAVMESWLDVEAAAVEAASSFWGEDCIGSLKSYPELGEYLFQCKVIDNKQLEIYRRLRQLRNKAAHAQELSLSDDDARSYVNLATALAAHIRAH